MLKYTGCVVDMIYMDRNGRFTRRRARVISVQDGVVRAYDVVKRAPRVFVVSRIMAVVPVRRGA